jgi:hypothetical protein
MLVSIMASLGYGGATIIWQGAPPETLYTDYKPSSKTMVAVAQPMKMYVWRPEATNRPQLSAAGSTKHRHNTSTTA